MIDKEISSSDKKTEDVFADLAMIRKLLYDKAGIVLSKFLAEKEGRAYAACRFELNGKAVEHRSAKITPAKQGLFVTIWKRNKEGVTAPLDADDDFDLLLITCKQHNKTGQFVFPKSVLINQKVISINEKGGKRGMRVYPNWETPDNLQAKKTQQWQCDHFIDLDDPEAERKISNVISRLT